METFKKIKYLIDGMEKDVEKIFIKNQREAAIRTRSKLQEIRGLSKELRQEIQDSLRNHQIDVNDKYQL